MRLNPDYAEGESTIVCILGIDPGTHRMGYGMVESNTAGDLSSPAWGVLSAKSSHELGERLHHLYVELSEVMAKFRPDEVAVEEPFVSVNARTAMAVGQAQGLALMAAAAQGISVSRYPPRQVKQAVSGYGGASKEQVQQAVAMSLDLDAKAVPEDAADALAVALCHVQNRRAAGLIAGEV